MSDDNSRFTVMSIEQACARLAELHGKVCQDKGRIEIRDGEGSCVLISREELDTLEQALEILSNTSDVRRMAATIEELVVSC